MFGYLFGMVGILAGLTVGPYFVFGRLCTLYGLPAKKPRCRVLRGIAAAGVLALSYLWRMVGLVAIHLVVIFALTELAAVFVRRLWKSPGRGRAALGKLYRTGLVPLALTAALLCWGGWNMSHVLKTEYTVASDKLRGSYQVVFFSDTHFGTVQSAAIVERMVAEVSALQPDAVILGGDMVEEGTSKAAMEEAFRLFGSIDATYGVYYVYGNHDRQHYTKDPSYTPQELAAIIEANGITILQDSWVELGEELTLAGRDDRGNRRDRASSEELLAGVDRGRYVMVADHQPEEAEENAAQGVDLQLSGHTHAGQLWPIGVITTLVGKMNYGQYEKDGCRVIVSSGVTGWGFPVRTQGKCEYVVVNLTGKQ